MIQVEMRALVWLCWVSKDERPPENAQVPEEQQDTDWLCSSDLTNGSSSFLIYFSGNISLFPTPKREDFL